MRKYLTLDEIQYEEKEILRKTIKFLDENKINYYISYGTMLGAVRHKGFIPWDDDIDISMPRNDFEKLVSIAKNNCEIDENLKITYYELKNSIYPFIKIVNQKIILDDTLDFDHNLWIDVFPLDSVPDDTKLANKFMKNTFTKAELYMVKNFKYVQIPHTTRTIKATIIKYLAKPFTMFFNKEKWMKSYLKFVQKYNDKNSDYIASVAWHGKKVIIFPKYILEGEMYDFEDIKVKGFKDYDKYLSLCYGGEYMKLPPKDKRYSHHVKAYINE